MPESRPRPAALRPSSRAMSGPMTALTCINVISSIDGAKVGMIFVEQADRHVKISWRALVPGLDVSPVARHFNGGGHAAAAGADIPGKLDEVQPAVLKITKEL